MRRPSFRACRLALLKRGASQTTTNR